MDINNYINSGILELYVAGALSDEENKEVYDVMLKHPEVLNEVLQIEAAILKLTEATAPKDAILDFNPIANKISSQTDTDTKVVNMKAEKLRSSWLSVTGWAAAVILGAGLFWAIQQNSELQSKIKVAETDKEFLEQQIEIADTDLKEAKHLITILRDKDILAIPLGGQAVYPEAYAKVYWDKATNSMYLDAQGLPEPPEGKVYQVWSLTLNPLTPTSLGTLDDFMTDDNKIFAIENSNASEAFGITLEPAGGSESPTLEQLYTLGTVASVS
ncbi:anti-sigma factor [Formosa algae]|uniref:Anti-sigma-K factor RskA n=1 Tax=Formosa algae TaxID=225843 RepID=A0A9X0YMX0_9FLAO|nr:anti-sigma factor [Formosa algae]MBP1841569.1 anti-sigma-K factor RskA [Formosa algae]MDQ0337038.1 anti-sigma-K factor RskA [Formosa algae]OEI80194.1 anti-sigma factor [Formosa algae]